jgi:outer membrane protein OmpA-like peptidoglycan-associated protein
MLYAQKERNPKQGMFSFSITLSDYNFVKRIKDSSLSYAMRQKDLFKAGNISFGFEVNYWRHLAPHIDFSGNLGGSFSNFPAWFVKGDSVGQAAVALHLDGLFHLKAFNDNAKVNPFLTAGLGAGYFGKQPAFYAPVGTGVELHFKKAAIIILQLQIRKALSNGITNDFVFYSAGFAQNIPDGMEAKRSAQKRSMKRPSPPGITDTSLSKKDINKVAITKAAKGDNVSTFADGDSDGVADNDDKCPDIKGSIKNRGCPFPVVDGAELLNMSADSVTYSIHFDFDQSILKTGAFTVLNTIVQIIKADKTLMIQISGHADNQGTENKNMQVSSDRANVTREYFMSYNIDASRIKTSYYGASRPIDKVQQWRNRRVEITIIKK